VSPRIASQERTSDLDVLCAGLPPREATVHARLFASRSSPAKHNRSDRNNDYATARDADSA
jgi:hypothetical protein